MTTDAPTTRMTRFWLPLPSRQKVYVVSTDHYPWSEVRADLEQRSLVSAMLEAQQDGRRGRLLWNTGAALGGFDQDDDLSADAFMRAFPRATLQLSLVESALVSLVWQCRRARPMPLSARWPQAQDQLSSSAFSGALLGGERGSVISYWQAGRPIAGSLPMSGVVYGLSAPRDQSLTMPALVSFWSQLLELCAQQNAEVTDAWRSCAAELAERHPCLDPFARDVWLDKFSIKATPDINVHELREALLAVFEAAFRKLRLRLRGLALGDLQTSPLWSLSGAVDLI